MLLFILLTVYPLHVKSKILHYNITEKEGLPSNQVYNTFTDHLGYLWLCTPKGLVKYNGYEQRIINNQDVWMLYEDDNARIWQYTVTDELGFLKNDKYHAVPLPGRTGVIKPVYIGPSVFGTVIQLAYSKDIILEKNGMARRYKLADQDPDAILIARADSTFIYLNHGMIFRIDLNRRSIRNLGRLGEDLTQKLITHSGNILLIYSAGQVRARNLKTMQTSTFELFRDPEEYIYTTFSKGNIWNVFTNKNYYRVIDSTGITTKVPIRHLVKSVVGEKLLLSAIQESSVWGGVISTATTGAFIPLEGMDEGQLTHQNIGQAVYLGRSEVAGGYWWDNIDQKIIRISHGKSMVWNDPAARNLKKIIPAGSGRLFTFSNDHLYWLSERNMQLEDWNFIKYPVYTQGIRDCYLKDRDTAYLISAGGFFRLSYHHHTRSKLLLDSGSFRAMSYDPLSGSLILYDNRKILIYHIPTGKKQLMNNLPGLFAAIEQLFFDERGNVFIKTEDRLVCYDRNSGTVTPVFSNLRLNNAQVAVNRKFVVAAGKFGVAIRSVDKPGSMGAVRIFSNTKGMYYDHIYGLQAEADSIFLNTNKGMIVLGCPAPDRTGHLTNMQDQFRPRLLAAFADTTVIIHESDTLKLSQAITSLVLDIINPAGSGKLFFSSSFNDPFNQKQLPGNQVELAGLPPGVFHTLYLKANDDVWESDPVKLNLFIAPYWYQTWPAIVLFIGLLVLFVLLLITITYYLTRKAIQRKNRQKNLLLEINNLRLDFELKSIYNQINPHFIFNTLNTSLYFIHKKKLTEAFDHISAFSELLRSYLASSKKKFIRLADEIENIENYITLQQARFEGRFTYQINIESDVSLQEHLIPPFLLQPIIENAIVHGLLPMEDKTGKLDLFFKLENAHNCLICIIEDNGIGRKKAGRYAGLTQERVHGGELIKELIEYYNKYEQTNIVISYIDKEVPETGTTVIINF